MRDIRGYGKVEVSTNGRRQRKRGGRHGLGLKQGTTGQKVGVRSGAKRLARRASYKATGPMDLVNPEPYLEPEEEKITNEQLVEADRELSSGKSAGRMKCSAYRGGEALKRRQKGWS